MVGMLSLSSDRSARTEVGHLTVSSRAERLTSSTVMPSIGKHGRTVLLMVYTQPHTRTRFTGTSSSAATRLFKEPSDSYWLICGARHVLSVACKAARHLHMARTRNLHAAFEKSAKSCATAPTLMVWLAAATSSMVATRTVIICRSWSRRVWAGASTTSTTSTM